MQQGGPGASLSDGGLAWLPAALPERWPPRQAAHPPPAAALPASQAPAAAALLLQLERLTRQKRRREEAEAGEAAEEAGSTEELALPAQEPAAPSSSGSAPPGARAPPRWPAASPRAAGSPYPAGSPRWADTPRSAPARPDLAARQFSLGLSALAAAAAENEGEGGEAGEEDPEAAGRPVFLSWLETKERRAAGRVGAQLAPGPCPIFNSCAPLPRLAFSRSCGCRRPCCLTLCWPAARPHCSRPPTFNVPARPRRWSRRRPAAVARAPCTAYGTTWWTAQAGATWRRRARTRWGAGAVAGGGCAWAGRRSPAALRWAVSEQSGGCAAMPGCAVQTAPAQQAPCPRAPSHPLPSPPGRRATPTTCTSTPPASRTWRPATSRRASCTPCPPAARPPLHPATPALLRPAPPVAEARAALAADPPSAPPTRAGRGVLAGADPGGLQAASGALLGQRARARRGAHAQRQRAARLRDLQVRRRGA